MRTLIFGLFALASWTSHALTISLDADLLKDANGAPMPTNGLVLLVASTGDSTFNAPTPTAFVSGDDIIIARFDLSSGGFNQPGVLIDVAQSLSFTGNWKPGDPLQMYWFPTLPKNATAPGPGAPYGKFRTDANGVDGGNAWVTGNSSDTINLRFITDDANTDYHMAGSNPAAAALASLTVAGPPPPPLLAIKLLGGGSVGIHLTGIANGNYALQYINALLNTNNSWLSLSNGTADSNGVIDFTDSVSTSPRFYRSQVLP